MTKVLNNSKRTYTHSIRDGLTVLKTYKVEAGKVADVPEDVAKIWLRSPDISRVGDEKKDQEIESLKRELEKMKAKVQDNPELEALRAEAKELGIKGYATSKADTLIKKIAEVKGEAEESAE